MNRPRTLIAFFTSALALGLAAEAGAAQLVTFTRGHSIVVQAAEKRGNWYYLTLEGGGEMGVPVKQVAKMEEYDLPIAPAAPEAAAQPAPQRATIPEPPPAAVAPRGDSSEAPSPDGNVVDANGMPQAPPAEGVEGVVDPNGADDWRSRVKMNVGANKSQPGGGRKPIGGWGAGRPPGANPFNRRPPNQQPQQPASPQQ
jgi:hypothetical protein